MNFNIKASDISMIKNENISYLDEMLLDSDGKLIVLPYKVLKDVPRNHLVLFCVKKGFYSIPTQELIDFLKEEIGDAYDQTIEIGSGNGVYSRELGIRGTDNLMQLAPKVRELYENMGQAIVPYGADVEKIDAVAAVKKYKPKIVIGAWCTHKYNPQEHWRGGNEFGINEKAILSKADKYIHIGNESAHDKKPILSKKHRAIKEDWILSRSQHDKKDVIYIWEK